MLRYKIIVTIVQLIPKCPALCLCVFFKVKQSVIVVPDMYVIFHHTLLVARQIGGRDEAENSFLVVFHSPYSVTI